MGIFREAGKRVERFKQQAAKASRDEAEYECRECDELVFTDLEECPHCGSESVAARSEPEDDERSADALAEADESAEQAAQADESAEQTAQADESAEQTAQADESAEQTAQADESTKQTAQADEPAEQTDDERSKPS